MLLGNLFKVIDVIWSFKNIEPLAGGAVAIDIAIREEVSQRIWCLIVENTFTSIPDMATILIKSTILQYLPLFCYKNKV